MSQDNGERRNLSVFTYSFIFICVVLVTILFVKEINVSSDFEDILYQSDEQNIDNYKRVFKEIFNILGHSAHYDMMMKKVK